MQKPGNNEPAAPLRLTDLARQLGLSTSTVSRALAGNTRIGADTVGRVQALATRLGYQPNVTAASLRTGRSQMLGVIVPHLRNNFFAHVVQSIEEAASQAGYHLVVCQSNDCAKRENQHLAALQRTKVAGILVSVARATQDGRAFEAVHRRGLPLVFFDRFVAGTKVSAVVIDDKEGAYQATRHLLAQGYQRIAHLAGPDYLSTYCQRRLGYEAALREAGRPVLPELVITSKLQLADGIAAARQLLALPVPPDAFFAASDFAALGCLQVLQELGRPVPAGCGVVGFGDEFFSQHTAPALSTISQHAAQLGRAATHLLLRCLAGWPSPAKHVQLQPTLLPRASSLRLPELLAS